MNLTKIIALGALLGFTEGIRLHDDSDPLGRNVDGTVW